MFEFSLFTGKVTTSGTGPNTTVVKKLYIKVFPGEFSFRAPRPKKAKKLIGEFVIRYSAKEWPIKKNGSIVGDPGFLDGISELLRFHNIISATDLSYAKVQHTIRDTVTIRLGDDLTQEILQRGWANLAK